MRMPEHRIVPGSPAMAARRLLVLLLLVGSGFPALIYQVVWQRSLFTLFGTDSVATAIIVSAFMLGLGAGSLLGGQVSRRSTIPLLKMFGGRVAAEIPLSPRATRSELSGREAIPNATVAAP